MTHIYSFFFFQINTHIERIDLEGNAIESDGAKYLGRMLRDNLYISEVVRFQSIQVTGHLKLIPFWVCDFGLTRWITWLLDVQFSGLYAHYRRFVK